ncbi:MAG: chloride channel protein [Ignavibacteriales bacterium]|nr:chloride channel protein [Ignavibacteriales bacterium]
MAAILLKTLVYYIHNFLTSDFGFSFQQYLLFILPLVGILLTVGYIKIFLKDKFGKGSAHILYSIAKKSSFIEKQTMYSHIITSAITVGFGGSAGLEAPIVVTGSAIGANYGRVNLLSYKERTLLLACGAASGIAAVFNAPVAGVMFALEVLLTEVSISAFIPLIISSAVGALCSKIILQENILLHFTLQQPFNYFNVPFYIGLGLLTGFVSIYYTRIFSGIEGLFKPTEKRNIIKACVGGLVLGLLILIFPPLFGEGYESIKVLANGIPEQMFRNSLFDKFSNNEWFVLFFILVVGLVKVVAASLTISSGGNGGNFAPSLFVGGFIGFFYSKFINLTFLTRLPVSNFTIVAMAGILCGVMHAPLTGIFLIAEITGGYELMIPLMIVSSITFILVKHFEPYSLDKKELAKKGELLTTDKDKNILTLLQLSEIIEKNFTVVSSDCSIHELINIISHSKRNIFPVTDKNDHLIGIISLDDIRELMFELDNFEDVFAIELMNKAKYVVQVNESMDSVMKKFDESGNWNLPVVDKNKYVGFISKSSVFTKYREKLKRNYSDE